MKQVKINDILYVMDTEAYAITADTDASIIYVPEDYYDDYVAINSGLTLTKYNYGVIRVTKPEYDVPEPPTPTKETRLVITYVVPSIAQPTPIYQVTDGTMMQPVLGAVDFSAIEIDGVDVPLDTIDNVYGKYQFTSTGEHTVKYTLKGNSIYENRFGEVYDMQPIVLYIKSIYIPSSLTSIGSFTFNTTFTENIIVDEDNTNYTSNGESGNCIVDKTTNILMYGSSNLVIPDGVVEIGDGVCRGQNIQNIVIPNSVTTIGDSCFYQSSLITLTIGSGVTTIKSESFTECENLTTVTIYGTNDLIDVIPYGVWGRLNTVYVDSSMVSTYQAFATDEGFKFEVLPIE